MIELLFLITLPTGDLMAIDIEISIRFDNFSIKFKKCYGAKSFTLNYTFFLTS